MFVCDFVALSKTKLLKENELKENPIGFPSILLGTVYFRLFISFLFKLRKANTEFSTFPEACFALVM